LHMAQLMLLPLTVSCFSKIQIGFTFLVPAHLGSPGKRAVKRVSVCLSNRKPVIVSSNERKTTVKLCIKLDWTTSTMLKPQLGTFKCQRLIIQVELVDKKLGPRQKVRQVTNSQNANPSDVFSSTLGTFDVRPLDVNCHEVSVVRNS